MNQKNNFGKFSNSTFISKNISRENSKYSLNFAGNNQKKIQNDYSVKNSFIKSKRNSCIFTENKNQVKLNSVKKLHSYKSSNCFDDINNVKNNSK